MKTDTETLLNLLISTDSKTGDPSIFADWDEVQRMYDELGWTGDPAEDGIMSIGDYADEQIRLGGFGNAESFADHILRFAAGDIEIDRDNLVAALESTFAAEEE